MKSHKCGLIATALLLVAGCNDSNPVLAPSGEGATVSVQLNWFPEAEHGGLYQAQADGTFDDAGLSVDIRPGGRLTPVGPELEMQRCQFAVANADDVILFRQEGIEVVALMAAMQNHPRCILARTDSGVKTFADLKGKTLQRKPGRAFVEFLRAEGHLDGVKEVPYHGSIASLVADPNIVIQAYSCSEPLLARQQGLEVTALMVSDLGFNPYCSVLVTTDKMIEEQPQVVKQVVATVRDGWRHYLTDATLGNDAILAANNHGMTEEALRFGAESMRSLSIPDDTEIDQVGIMTDQRWTTLHQQLVDLKLVDPDKVKASDCYTLEFLE